MLTASPTKPASTATEYALRMHGVHFCYCAGPLANGRLYEDFSLNVEQGAVVALMGASGCGKSTLGKLIARILRPTAGRVDWSPAYSRRCDVVYIDQHPMNSVFPWHTVRRNLEYPLEKLGWEVEEARARIGYLVSLFRLEGVLDALPAQISGGELQRVALARCLSWRPELVVLDEPFSALDRHVKEQITAALHELAARDGMTLVLITHNIADALAIASRCVVVGERPVRILSDMEFHSPYPRDGSGSEYEEMQAALVRGIREGLV
ncbi:MAG: ABC transporter ATP-binding protein [Terriglobales bacterium]